MNDQLRVRESEGETDTESDDSESETCLDCLKILRERKKEIKFLEDDIKQKERFRCYVWGPHNQTWLNYDADFLYCANCFSILVPIQKNHGTLVDSSDKKLWKQLCGEYKPVWAYNKCHNSCDSFENCKCKQETDTVNGYYVLSDINKCQFENVSIWVDVNYQAQTIHERKFRENFSQCAYHSKYSKYMSMKNYTPKIKIPSLMAGIDTNFIHCDSCLNGPVGYLELNRSKPIGYFALDGKVGICRKSTPQKKQVPFMHHRNLPLKGSVL